MKLVNNTPIIEDYFEVYLKKKSADCILYSIDGFEFKIHRELLSQTKFLREILSSAKDRCCGMLEIFCPCSEQELTYLVSFLHNGEICCKEQIEADKVEENLVKIFGYNENNDFEMDILTEKRFFDHCLPICENLSLHNKRSYSESDLSDISLEDISDESLSDDDQGLINESHAMDTLEEILEKSPDQLKTIDDISIPTNDKNGLHPEKIDQSRFRM